MDDILVMSNSDDLLNNVLDLLEERFKFKRLGPASWILSLHVTQSPHYIVLDQSQCIREILHRYGMDDCSPASTPIAESATLKLDNNHTLAEADRSLYHSMVGSLMYAATCSRPDISFAVGKLGRFSHQPTQAHLNATKRVLRYLQGIKGLQLVYRS